MKKILISLLNLLTPGIGNSLIGEIKKAIIYQLSICLIFLVSALTGLIESYNGFIITYVCVIILWLYAFLELLLRKNSPTFEKWYKGLFYFIL